MILRSYRSNGSEVDKELARRRDAETVELHYEAVEIAERKVGRDEIDVNMETALRYKGFTAHNALDYAFIFQYYFFHNAVSPAEVSSTKCGILGEEGKTKITHPAVNVFLVNIFFKRQP